MTTSKQLLQTVVDWLTTVEGVQEVSKGILEFPQTATSVFVTAGPREISDQFAGQRHRGMTFYIWTGYRVAGREDDAEDRLLDVGDAIEESWNTKRKTEDLFRESILDMTMAGAPEYRDYTEEYRVYPISLTMVIRQPLNP